MSDWHFGMDYDMWLYPPVPWWKPDYDYELPEPIEAANIEGTLLVNADDAIEQVRGLQAENAKLHEELEAAKHDLQVFSSEAIKLNNENVKLRERITSLEAALEGMHLIREQDMAENDELRKLLGKYHYTLLALKEEDDNSPCPLYICPDTTICPWDNESCPFVEAINELGIEADE